MDSATQKIKTIEEERQAALEVVAVYEKYYEKVDGCFKIPEMVNPPEMDFPVAGEKDQIIGRLREHDVLIIRGETGSGNGVPSFENHK